MQSYKFPSVFVRHLNIHENPSKKTGRDLTPTHSLRLGVSLSWSNNLGDISLCYFKSSHNKNSDPKPHDLHLVLGSWSFMSHFYN